MNLALDTSTYTLLAKNDKELTDIVRKAIKIYMPLIVIGELFDGFYGGNRRLDNEEKLYKFMHDKHVAPLTPDMETAREFGRLKAYLRKKGTPIPTNDVWIAALCVQHDLPLLTRDKDFQKLAQLTLL